MIFCQFQYIDSILNSSNCTLNSSGIKITLLILGICFICILFLLSFISRGPKIYTVALFPYHQDLRDTTSFQVALRQYTLKYLVAKHYDDCSVFSMFQKK